MKKIIEKMLLAGTRENEMDVFESIRVRAALPHVSGKVLDIGCGFNNLVQKYSGEGIGVDVYNWGGRPDVVVTRTDHLPFKDKSFDTVTFLASLNHISYRAKALKEAHRVLRPKGKIVLTMIGPFVGKIAHFFEGKDEEIRGFGEGEVLGLSKENVLELLVHTGFKNLKTRRILYVFPNMLYIAEKLS